MKRQNYSEPVIHIVDKSSELPSRSISDVIQKKSITRRSTNRKALGDLTSFQVSSRKNVNAGTAMNNKKGDNSEVKNKTSSLNSESISTSVEAFESVTNSDDESLFVSQHDLHEMDAICSRKVSEEKLAKLEAERAARNRADMIEYLKSDIEYPPIYINEPVQDEPVDFPYPLVSFTEFLTDNEQNTDM